MAHSWCVYLLPYIEQDNLYKLYNFNAPLYADPNASVVKTPLKIFQCPSSPNKGRLYTANIPANVLPALPGGALTASTSDYSAITGVRKWDILVAPDPAKEASLVDIGQRHGILRGVSQETPSIASPQMGIADVTDGTTNTFLVGEIAGRPDIYNARRQIIVPGASAPFSMGAGWGDPFNGETWPGGTTASGDLPVPDGGPCIINCSNVSARGFYSFHSGGANFVMADGSVRFFAESTPTRVIAFMITSQRGEVIPN